MAIESLKDLYVHQLKDLYSAETQIIKALPKRAKAATMPELRTALLEHLEQTRRHVERLDQLFERLGKNPKGQKCKGMQALIEEGEERMNEQVDDAVLNAWLIAAAQRVEHYEIAGYGTARAYAEQLGDEDAADLLQETLGEEGRADKNLSLLAENRANIEATEGYKSFQPA